MTVKSKFKTLAFLLVGSIAFSSTSFEAPKEIMATAVTESTLVKSGDTLYIELYYSKINKQIRKIDIPANATTTEELGTITIDDSHPIYFKGNINIGGYERLHFKHYEDKHHHKYIDPTTTSHVSLHTTVIPSKHETGTYTYTVA